MTSTRREGGVRFRWTGGRVQVGGESDDLFLVIDQVFQISRIFTVLNVVYDPFFTRKTTISQKNSFIRPIFYSLRTFTRIRQHYFSKYWGTDAWAVPPPQILGDRPPQAGHILTCN